MSLWHKRGMLTVVAQTVPGLSATMKHGPPTASCSRCYFWVLVIQRFMCIHDLIHQRELKHNMTSASDQEIY